MINEVKQVSGDVEFGGPVSYGECKALCRKLTLVVPQQAWVQSGMIRDNITLSATRDEVDDQWLDQVIDACALRPDMNMWPDGDR
jgi:ATP-binding cassette subfamily C (CFTR/MRP) protein 1